MPVDRATAKRELAFLLPQFYLAVTNGVRSYYADYAAVSHQHRTTTRRCIIRDAIVYQLRGPLEGVYGVRLLDRNQTTYVQCYGRYNLLVKKSDETGLVELAKTQASFEFQTNEPQGLFDLDITNLYLSYIPNQLEPQSPTVLLICPNVDGYAWVLELEPPEVHLAGTISGSGPPPDDSDDLVRIPSFETPKESE